MYCTQFVYSKMEEILFWPQNSITNFFNLPILKEFQHIVVVFLYFNKKEMHIFRICLLYYVAYKYLDFFFRVNLFVLFSPSYSQSHIFQGIWCGIQVLLLAKILIFYEEGIDIHLISLQIFLVQKQPFKSFNKQNTFLLNCHIRVVPLKIRCMAGFSIKVFSCLN